MGGGVSFSGSSVVVLVLDWIPEGRPRHRRKENICINVQEIRWIWCETADWIHLTLPDSCEHDNEP